MGDLLVVGLRVALLALLPKINRRNVDMLDYARALKPAVEGFEKMTEADVIHYDLAFLGVTESLPLKLSRRISPWCKQTPRAVLNHLLLCGTCHVHALWFGCGHSSGQVVAPAEGWFWSLARSSSPDEKHGRSAGS